MVGTVRTKTLVMLVPKRIRDGRVAHALLLEVLTNTGVGTMVVPA